MSLSLTGTECQGSETGRRDSGPAAGGQSAKPNRSRCHPWRTKAAVSSLITLIIGLNSPNYRAEQPRKPETSAPAIRSSAAPAKRVREPAVAGLFYPKDAEILSKMIDGMLNHAGAEYIPNLKGLVCPHAGYAYSGSTAAVAYRQVRGREFKTVLIMAPSHYAAFEGASVSSADVFRTPLGTVGVSERAQSLARLKPFVPETPARVDRPSWWKMSSRSAPTLGQDTPDTWEHADEVQVPFLQRVLPSVTVIPIVFGVVDPAEAARALASQLDDQTLLIASSDLSHYHSYAEASALDRRCVQTICALDLEQMKSQEACGKATILTLIHLARLRGWRARLLDYHNSGDTGGDHSRVVGYSAIAFYAPGEEKFTPRERELLVRLARQTIKETATRSTSSELSTNGLPPKFSDPKGCFVTLTKNGQLRGCIGQVFPQQPLWRAISSNARSAATRDPRFPPISADELEEIQIEISILTEPRRLQFDSSADLLKQLRPYQDGVVLRIGEHSATFLPQVWAQIPDKMAFLNRLAEKAGCEAGAWRGAGTSVFTYQVESFKEME